VEKSRVDDRVVALIEEEEKGRKVRLGDDAKRERKAAHLPLGSKVDEDR